MYWVAIENTFVNISTRWQYESPLAQWRGIDSRSLKILPARTAEKGKRLNVARGYASC